MSLIHRSLERIRLEYTHPDGLVPVTRQTACMGGTRVKCLLYVAAGVVLCCFAMLLLAHLYTTVILERTAVSPRKLAQLRSQALEKKAAPKNSPARTAPGFQKKKSGNQSPRTVPRIPQQTGTQTSSGYDVRIPERHISHVPQVRRQPRSQERRREEIAREEGLDQHFIRQARHNELVLQLERGLRSALRRKNMPRAADLLQKLLRAVGARSLSGLRWQGFYALSCGQWRQAEQYFDAVLSRKPGDVGCLYNLTLAQLRQGKKELAASGYRRLKGLAPQSPVVRRLSPYFEPGRLP